MPNPRTFRDIIELWPRPSNMARQLNVSRQSVCDWSTRNRIPTRYWLTIIAALGKMGYTITGDDLLRIEQRSAPGDIDPAHRLAAADREYEV